jgi:hypothetical protein
MYENGMTYEEWEMMHAFVDRKSVELMHAQKKPFAIAGMDISHWTVITVMKKRFFVVSRHIFSEIIEEVLVEAVRRFPEKFGTGRAEDVIEAIYEVSPEGRREDFAELLRVEQFCYVLQIVDGVVNERVLRIDLFRMIEANEEGGTDFTGGAFHALKHFSFDGVPLSTHKASHDIHPRFIIIMLTKAFFIDLDHGKQVNPNVYKVVTPLDEKYDQVISFYYESEAAVYFVKTIFKKMRKKDK